MSRHKLPNKNFEWTPKIAYVIGLLTTDGNLSKDGRHVTLRSSDIQLLKTFKKCLPLSCNLNIIQTKNDGFAKRPCYKIEFSNVQFYRWLLKIGLFPAKTYTIGKIKVPKNYFRDFLRGHLDGDGSVWTYKDCWNTFKNPKYIYTRLFVRFMSASKVHMCWLRKIIYKIIFIKGHVFERKPWRSDQTTSIHELKFAKKDSVKLLSWIYYNRNVPCLKRKRKIAEKFITL